MAEAILSPGVFQNETDQSFISSAPIGSITALVGPTVFGQPLSPTLVTSYTDYLAKFGSTFKSGSTYYEYFTSLAAKNFFANGGQTLLVTRVIENTGSVSTYATSTIYNSVAIAATSSNIPIVATGSLINGTTFTITGSADKFNSSSYGLFTLLTGSLPTDSAPSYYISVATSSTLAQNTTAIVSKINSLTSTFNITATTVSSTSMSLAATLYADNETLGNGFKYISGSTTYTLGGAKNATASFTLETIAWGDIMNNYNGTSSVTSGVLTNGTAYNVRWEITNVNTSSGQFTLAIRSGNDNNNQKSYLEIWNNLSLDPGQDNYISRVIGDLKPIFTVDSDGIPMVDFTGSYANKSRYVRIKSVVSQPDSIDNLGIFNSAYVSTLPTTEITSTNGAFNGGVTASNLVGLYNENITNSNIQGFSPASYQKAFNLLASKESYTYNVIVAPGITLASSVADTVIDNCELRGDAIVPLDTTLYGATISEASTATSDESSNYAAAYYPWVQVYSEGLDKPLWCPPTTIIPGVYANNDQVGAEWFAPAGFTRGNVPSVIRAERRLSQNDRDTLYENNINPIASFNNKVTVFGQKTLQKEASALDRVNVRRLMIALKNYIGIVAKKLVFEQNTNVTRNGFLAQVNPYLDSVKQRQGLYAYKVVMDSTNNTNDTIDRNQLVGQIYIQPTRAAEFVILNFNLQPTGATFPA